MLADGRIKHHALVLVQVAAGLGVCATSGVFAPVN